MYLENLICINHIDRIAKWKILHELNIYANTVRQLKALNQIYNTHENWILKRLSTKVQIKTEADYNKILCQSDKRLIIAYYCVKRILVL